MGVTKSKGPRAKPAYTKTGEGNHAPDNVNKDIYYEKEFGNSKDGWKNALYKDKLKPDPDEGFIKHNIFEPQEYSGEKTDQKKA